MKQQLDMELWKEKKMNNKNQIEKIMTDDKVNVMSKLNLLEILLKNRIINSREAREYLGIENKQK